MKLTIVVPDNCVGKNGLFYKLDIESCQIPPDVLALQWDTSFGHIEFTTRVANQEITALPNWANDCLSLWDQKDYEEKHPPEPTEEEKIFANKIKASGLLLDSDWSALPDVSLQNKTDWLSYRSSLRQIAINPTLNPEWPSKPPAIWE